MQDGHTAFSAETGLLLWAMPFRQTGASVRNPI